MPMRREHAAFAAFALTICVALVGCASRVVESINASPAATIDATLAVPSDTPRPSVTPAADVAPDELAGIWRRNVGGELVLLTMDGNGYSIQRGGALGSGRISVGGDRITFSGSNRCDGVGIYMWAIEDGRLRLTELEEDPCSGRTDVFLFGTFGRVEP